MCLLLLVLSCVIQQAIGQTAKLLTRFPFKILTGGIVILNAQVGNAPDTLNFVLDTGSGGISLDSATVEYLQLPLTATATTIRGIAGVKRVDYAMDQTLHLPGLSVKDLDFHVLDYEILTAAYGYKIDGIIGYSFLSRYIVKLNYDNNTIEVWSHGSISYPRNGYVLKPKMQTLPIVNAEVKDDNKASMRYLFDTGAGLSLLLSEQVLKDSNLLKKNKKIIVTQGEGLGGKKTMNLSTVKEVRLGPYKFKKVPVHVFDDTYKLLNYPEMGGIIGNDILRRFNVIINYGKKEIHLKPNTHYGDPFDYSYTGLGIYLVDGLIVIEDVIAHSPGEKAGLKPGDIIVALENKFSQDLQTIKAMLQTPGVAFKMIISRNGQLMVVKLKVASIL